MAADRALHARLLALERRAGSMEQSREPADGIAADLSIIANGDPPLVEVGKLPAGCWVALSGMPGRWSVQPATPTSVPVFGEDSIKAYLPRTHFVRPIPHPVGPEPGDTRLWHVLWPGGFVGRTVGHAGVPRQPNGSRGWWLCPVEAEPQPEAPPERAVTVTVRVSADGWMAAAHALVLAAARMEDAADADEDSASLRVGVDAYGVVVDGRRER